MVDGGPVAAQRGRFSPDFARDSYIFHTRFRVIQLLVFALATMVSFLGKTVHKTKFKWNYGTWKGTYKAEALTFRTCLMFRNATLHS